MYVVSSRADVFSVWDKKQVIIRDEDGFVFVYPRLGRGVKYPEFDLRRECCLNTFVSVSQAIAWSQARGYSYVVMR